MKKILIAEDNDSNYMLMTYVLKKHYEFVRARNGQEAVDKVDTEKPDLVFMDLKMPLLDGLEATRQIKAKYPDLPVIALTANAFDTDKDDALQAGCNDFLSKPISSKLCLETIAKFI
ncbi:MAG: response regulator [Prevotella sp.]|nr:response regulator [Prevotella sp.]